MKIHNVTVKFKAGKIFKNNWGESQASKVTMCDGKELDIWGKPNTEICKWSPGEVVMISEENGKYKAIESDKPFPAPIAAAVQDTKLENAETKRMIEMYAIRPPENTILKMIEYIEFETKVYNQCLKVTMKNVDCDPLKPEAVKDIATTMFIQLMRKFNV